MKVAVVGWRHFPHPNWVVGFINTLDITDVVISGDGGVVDKTAQDTARARGMTVIVFPADWSNGRAAGPIRNTDIVANADWVVAFWDGKSRGTQDTISKARKADKPVLIVYTDGVMIGKRPTK